MCKWISVKDRLPKELEDVFFYDAVIDWPSFGHYSDGRWWVDLDAIDAKDVSHWKPYKSPAEEARDVQVDQR